MQSKKLRNIALSAILIALYASAILLLSAKNNSGDISPLYIWMKMTTLVAGFSGLLMLVLRIFKVIDRDRNFLYTLLGTANMVLGLLGICFYFLNKINITGLHDMILNLFVGVVVLSDVFLLEIIFKKNETN